MSIENDPDEVSFGGPDEGQVELAITFLYYRDLAAAMEFYEGLFGFKLAIDQGWSKIYRISGAAHIGLVDETRGAHRANSIKPVQICIRVPDVDAWHAWLSNRNVDSLSIPKTVDELGIRVFTLNDPEGYQIEVQSAIR